MAFITRKRILKRTGTLALLEELAATPAEEAVTLCIPPHLPADDLGNTLKEIPAPPEVLTEISKISEGSGTGAVVFWGAARKLAVLPPFPVAGKCIFPAIETEPLCSIIERDRLIALVLVRLGSYAVGVCEGEKLVSSKVGTGLVHGRHRQGGSSAHRFERHRDKQIEYFLTRVCGRCREHIEPYAKSLDYIVYGGARTTVQLLRKQCPFIARLETPALPPQYDIPEPRQSVLENAVKRVWSSTVYEWRED